MSFVSPWIAGLALASIAIPILLHLLFRRRRRPIAWGAMWLLREAAKRHRRRARLEHLLLLALRCLALLLIGAALAEPLFSSIQAFARGTRLVVVVLDDGLSSGIISENGEPELSQSKAAVKAVLEELSPGDEVVLISAARPSRLLTEEPTLNHTAVLRMLDSVEPSHAATDIDGAIALARETIRGHDNNGRATVFLATAGRGGSLFGLERSIVSNRNNSTKTEDPAGQQPNSVEFLVTEPTNRPTSFVAVESIRIRRPIEGGGSEQSRHRATVTLKRLGPSAPKARSLVRLSGDAIEDVIPRQLEWSAGQLAAQVEFLVEASSSSSDLHHTSAITASIDEVALRGITSRSSLLDTSRTIRVGLVSRRTFETTTTAEDMPASTWVSRALEPTGEDLIDVVLIDPISLSARAIEDMQALILLRADLLKPQQFSALGAFVARGGFLFILPPEDLESHLWLDTLASALEIDLPFAIEPEDLETPQFLSTRQPGGALLHRITQELDQLASPVSVTRRLRAVGLSDTQVLLRTEDDEPVLLAWPPQGDRRGTVALLTVAAQLSWTTLPVKPLMVPLFQELVRAGGSFGRDARSLQSGEQLTRVEQGVEILHGPSGERVGVNEKQKTTAPLRATGAWRAIASDGTTVRTIVVNPEFLAADPTLLDSETLLRKLPSGLPWTIDTPSALAGRFKSTENNSNWPAILLVFALATLIFETVLNKVFSHAYRERLLASTPGEVA